MIPERAAVRNTFPLLCLMTFILAAGWTFSLAAVERPPDRHAVYETYLEFGRLVDGGRVTPHWMLDGSSFWCVQHEIVALPGQYHGYVGKSLEYLLEKQTRFFEEHLTPYRRSRE